jgi:hypothetical protein
MRMRVLAAVLVVVVPIDPPFWFRVGGKYDGIFDAIWDVPL